MNGVNMRKGERNQQGFTLIEAVVAFAIFLMIVSFLPLFINSLQYPNVEKQLNHMEMTVFYNQVAMEVREVSGISIANNRLIFEKGDDLISYEMYGDRIRRQVNGMGHEIVLQNVIEAQFELVNQGVIITVFDMDGRNYSRRLSKVLGEN